MLELKAKHCDLPALGLMARAEFLMQERAKHIPDGHSSHQGPQQSSLQAMLSDYSLSPWRLSSECQLPPAHQLEKSHTGGQLWALQRKVQQRAVVPCSTTALNLTLNWRAVARWCVCQWETAWAGMIKQTVTHSKPKKHLKEALGSYSWLTLLGLATVTQWCGLSGETTLSTGPTSFPMDKSSSIILLSISFPGEQKHNLMLKKQNQPGMHQQTLVAQWCCLPAHSEQHSCF